MKRVSISIFMMVLFCLLMTAAIHAQGPVPVQIPNYINYQGKLLRYPRNPDRAPIPANGTHTMIFRIYDAEDAPIDSPLWEETHVDVNVEIGIFNVLLGEVNPLYLRFEQDYWLGLEVYPDYEMQPRQRIVSTGYSFMSQDSYSLNGYVSGEGNGLNADMVDGRHYSDMVNEITSHSRLKTTHGVSGQIVGTTDDQVLTNKHISGEQIDSGTIDDARIPDDISINKAKYADTVDGFHATDTLDEDKLVVYGAVSTEIDNRITAHKSAYGHLSNTQKDGLLSGNDTTLHYHASDRDLANSTGVLDKSHLDAGQVQLRVTNACGPGHSIRTINEDGSVVCEPDDINDAVSNPSGTYNSMKVGYASSAGNANSASSCSNASAVNGLQFSPLRECVWVGLRGTNPEPRERGAWVWPSNWSMDSCKKMVCKNGLWDQWDFYEYYSDGTFKRLGYGPCP